MRHDPPAETQFLTASFRKWVVGGFWWWWCNVREPNTVLRAVMMQNDKQCQMKLRSAAVPVSYLISRRYTNSVFDASRVLVQFPLVSQVPKGGAGRRGGRGYAPSTLNLVPATTTQFQRGIYCSIAGCRRNPRYSSKLSCGFLPAPVLYKL